MIRFISKTLRRWKENPFQTQRGTLRYLRYSRSKVMKFREDRAIRMDPSFSDYLESSSRAMRSSINPPFHRSH